MRLLVVRRKTVAAGAAVMIFVGTTATAVQNTRRAGDPRVEVIAGTIAAATVLICAVSHRVVIAVRTKVVAVAVVQLGTETTVAAYVVQLVTDTVLEGLLLLLMLLLGRNHGR